MPMPSTPSSNGEFHDGFDDFFNGEDEALPSLPRNTLDQIGDSEEEALPQIDLSSFSFEAESSSVDGDHDSHIEDDDGEYFDDEAWEEEPDESSNLAYSEEEDGEEGPYYMEDEESWNDDDSTNDASGISDDELDDLLNFDDDSWMDEDDSGEDNAEDSYYFEDEEQPEGDDSIYLDEEDSIELRKDTDQSAWDDEEESWSQDEEWDDEDASEGNDAMLILDDQDEEEDLPVDTAEEEEPSAAKAKKGESSPWKSKLADFKRKAQAELQGNSSEGVTDNDEDELDPDEEEAPEEEQGATRAPRRGASSGPLATLRNLAIFRIIGRLLRTRPLLFLARILRPIKAAYLFVVNTVLKALEWTLGLLGRIPVIGKPFRWLRDLTEVLRYIATCIPVILFIILVVYLNHSAVPPKVDASMPDDGHLTISSMSYDGDTQSAVGTIVNDGEIIAEVQPKFTVYSSSPLNPVSWAFPKKQMECLGTVVKLEAGESRVVKTKCSQGAGGLFKKTSATLITQ